MVFTDIAGHPGAPLLPSIAPPGPANPEYTAVKTAGTGIILPVPARLPITLSHRNTGYPFFGFGASIMFIFLPSSVGIISTFATASRSVAKRSNSISPCSLKTMLRPRKKT